jgi:hypothetical protein
MVGATQSSSTQRLGKRRNSTTSQQQKSCCSLQQAKTLFCPHQKFCNSPGHSILRHLRMKLRSILQTPHRRMTINKFYCPPPGGYPYCTSPCNYPTITINFSASACSQFIYFFSHSINFTKRRTPSYAHTVAHTL